jgi:hypothetical protein
MLSFASMALSLLTGVSSGAYDSMWVGGAAPRDAAPTMQSLSEPELRVLLRDVFLTPVFPGGIVSSDRGEELFSSDGSYVRYFHRVRAEGSFAIIGDLVCVQLPRRQPPCRRVFRDQQGRLFISGSDISTAPFVRFEIRLAI